jgi:CheY-like chemotaxis protein
MADYDDSILLVDDDANDRFLIERAFRLIGMGKVTHAVADAHEAIAYIKGEGPYADRALYPYPTFVITDLDMPRADGFELLAFLHDHAGEISLPVVVFTSSSDADDIKRAYLLGARSYHVKPNSFEQLRSQMAVLHEYWKTSHFTQADAAGSQRPGSGNGKLGERFT